MKDLNILNFLTFSLQPFMKKNRKQSQAVTGKSGTGQPPERLLVWMAAAAIAFISWLVISPALQGHFTNWDDDTYVTANSIVQSNTIAWKEIFSQPVALNYHPLTVLTLAWNHQSAALDPYAYLTTNLFLHTINSVLVFLFFYLLSGKKIITGSVTGLLFAIHPMHIESVAWISGRKDVLYVFFFMLSLLAYLRYRNSSQKLWLFACFLLFVLSCLSKAMAVVLPVVLLLIDYCQQRKITWRATLEKIPFFAFSLVIGIVAVRMQEGSANAATQSFTVLQQFIFGSYGFLMYLIKFLLPVSLSALYPYPVSDGLQPLPLLYYAAPLVWLAAGWFIYRTYQSKAYILFGAVWFMVTIALVLQFISVGNAIMADRYSYLSYAGLAYIAGYSLEKIYRDKPAMRTLSVLVLAVVMLVFCYMANDRSRVWNNSESLWTDVINKYPQSATAYKNRGNFYGENGNSAAALKDYSKLLSMQTNDAEVYNNLGNIYADQGKLPASIDAYSKAITLRPDYVNAYTNRGISYNAMNQGEKAIDDFTKAIELNGKNASLLAQRGYTFYTMGKYQEAVTDFSRATELQPDHAAAYYCRGLSYYELKDQAAALSDLQKARSLGYEGDFSLLQQLQMP